MGGVRRPAPRDVGRIGRLTPRWRSGWAGLVAGVLASGPVWAGVLQGQVVDPDGLPVPGARLQVSRDSEGVDDVGADRTVKADSDGRFELELAPGIWQVELTRRGFVDAIWPVEMEVGVDRTRADFTLAPERVEQVVVHATDKPWHDVARGERTADPSTLTGVYELTRRDLESTPGSLEDIARATHALPGVVSDGDLFAGFHVRGGEQGDVVFLLDRVPLENPFHLAGFNSLFNPDMVQKVDFYAGAAPAEVPSATSAVLDVTSWDGSCPESREGGCSGLDGAIDLSASSARFFLTGGLDRDRRLTFALAARRTYMEGYFAVLKAVNLIDTAFVAPEFSELSGRLAWRPHPRHRLLLSAVQAGDRLGLVDSEDDSTIQFDGAFELRTQLSLFSLDHRYRDDAGGSLQTTVAYTRDRSSSNRELARDTLTRDIVLQRLFARTDGVWPLTDNARVKVGGDASRFQVDSRGQLQDQRAFPRWVQAGIGSFGFQVADVQPQPDPWFEANAYAQTEIGVPFGFHTAGDGALARMSRRLVERTNGRIVPGLRVRAGARLTFAGLTGELLASPRAGVSMPLPTGTIPKVSFGQYQRVLRDPFQLSPGFGTPGLRAERASQVVFGIDQAFPLPGPSGGGLFRVEVYDVRLTDLVVNPDTEAAVQTGPAWTNDGTGRSYGVDWMVNARGGRANATLAYGLLWTKRFNPRNTQFTQTIAPPQDQRHTLSLSADVQPFQRWRFNARYQYHSGRPLAEVELLSAEWESIQLSCLNCSRIGPTHSIDLRAEWRRAYERYRLTFYLELLNVGNIQSQFLPIHDVIDGEVSTTWLNHLPMRPFLGLRADF